MKKIKNNDKKEDAQKKREKYSLILGAKASRGAGWFYWIAGLSLINTAVFYLGGGISFIVGLAITQIIEGFLSYYGTIGIVISVVLNMFVAGIFAGLGYFADKKRMNLAFLVGMILYIIDTLLFLIVMDILSIGFHIYALVNIFLGYKANRKLQD